MMVLSWYEQKAVSILLAPVPGNKGHKAWARLQFVTQPCWMLLKRCIKPIRAGEDEGDVSRLVLHRNRAGKNQPFII
jgi:hypothetical protein